MTRAPSGKNRAGPRALAVRLAPADRARFERLARAYGGVKSALIAGIDALEQLERERWRRMRPFHGGYDGPREPPPDAPPVDLPQAPAATCAGEPPAPVSHGAVYVRAGAVVVGQKIPWYANVYDFIQAYAAEIEIVSLGRLGDPSRQRADYRISQIDTAPGHLNIGDIVRLDGGHFVRVTRLNGAVIHAGHPVIPASVVVAPESDRHVTAFQILKEIEKLPRRRMPPPEPYRRSFKEEVALPDLLEDLTVAPAPVRQDALAIFALVDRAPDAATSKAFMAGVKAIWTDEERAAFRHVMAYRRRRQYGWEP